MKCIASHHFYIVFDSLASKMCFKMQLTHQYSLLVHLQQVRVFFLHEMHSC
jgi:hypothetical protein